jgi:hypothetical protein
MHFSINVDHDDFLSLTPPRIKTIRAAAYFLLHAIGDMDEKQELDPDTAQGRTTKITELNAAERITSPLSPVPSFNVTFAESAPVPPPPTAPVADVRFSSNPNYAPPAPVPPPPVSAVPSANTSPPVSAINDSNNEDLEEDGDEGDNVVQGNFPYTPPPPPPPPPVSATVPPSPSPSAAPTAGTNNTGIPATTAAGVNSVASAEVDKSGMPWDARIHQSGKSVKKDGTWKLKKGIDQSIVQVVTAELAAKRGLLPINAVPMPPQQNAAPASNVPPPPAATSAPVPVPPPPAAGPVGASTSAYQNFLDRVIAETKAGKITHQRVSQICQEKGAPSLSELVKMQHLLPDIERTFEMVVLGLA